MKKIIMALAAATFLAGTAGAATIQGVVTEYDMDTRVLSLADGMTYTIPIAIPVPPELKVGDRVTVVTDDNNPKEVDSVLLTPMQ